MEGVAGCKGAWVLVFAAVLKASAPGRIFNGCIIFRTFLFPGGMILLILLVNAVKLSLRLPLNRLVVKVKVVPHINVSGKAFTAHPVTGLCAAPVTADYTNHTSQLFRQFLCENIACRRPAFRSVALKHLPRHFRLILKEFLVNEGIFLSVVVVDFNTLVIFKMFFSGCAVLQFKFHV